MRNSSLREQQSSTSATRKITQSQNVAEVRAIRRELLEETGVDVAEVGKFLFDFIYPSRQRVTVQLNFLVDAPVKARVRVDTKEHDSFRWVSFSLLEGSDLSPNVKRGISLAIGPEPGLPLGGL